MNSSRKWFVFKYIQSKLCLLNDNRILCWNLIFTKFFDIFQTCQVMDDWMELCRPASLSSRMVHVSSWVCRFPLFLWLWLCSCRHQQLILVCHDADLCSGVGKINQVCVRNATILGLKSNHMLSNCTKFWEKWIVASLLHNDIFTLKVSNTINLRRMHYWVFYCTRMSVSHLKGFLSSFVSKQKMLNL